MLKRKPLLAAALAGWALLAAAPVLAQENPPPKRQDWAALADLPDWSGVWTPNVTDQDNQIRTNPAPWTASAKAKIDRMLADDAAGKPFNLLVGCMPPGMPTLMLITHNALEFLFTPGRVTVLGESDGNRLRRIYTDGRPHPEDPDLTLHGHSIGHWEGNTLVVETVGIVPEAWIAIHEAVGVPNNGDMRIVERLHLAGPDELHDDLEITAPKVMTKPWKTTRIYHRQRERAYDIVEGQCVRGDFTTGTDADGYAVYLPLPRSADGSVVPLTPAGN